MMAGKSEDKRMQRKRMQNKPERTIRAEGEAILKLEYNPVLHSICYDKQYCSV